MYGQGRPLIASTVGHRILPSYHISQSSSLDAHVQYQASSSQPSQSHAPPAQPPHPASSIVSPQHPSPPVQQLQLQQQIASVAVRSPERPPLQLSNNSQPHGTLHSQSQSTPDGWQAAPNGIVTGTKSKARESPPETLSTLEESLKRTVTVVFWHKAGCEPVRFRQDIPTYPLVRLVQFTRLVSALALTSDSLVDAYDPEYQTWGQQPITAVQKLHDSRPLLYRMRTSIFEGLVDKDCPGLEHELRMQHTVHSRPPSPLLSAAHRSLSFAPRSPPQADPPPLPSSPSDKALKRPAPDGTSENAATKRIHAESSPGHARSSSSASFPSPRVKPSAALGTPQVRTAKLQHSPASSSGKTLQSPFMQRDVALHASSSLSSSSSDTAAAGSPQHPAAQAPAQASAPSTPASAAAKVATTAANAPTTKRWPNDYAVCELAEGFAQMDALVRSTPSLKQHAAFARVFNCRYVKSTFCRHRGLFKRASPAMRDAFVRMGVVEAALWGEFVKRIPPDVGRSGGGGSSAGPARRGSSGVAATVPQQEKQREGDMEFALSPMEVPGFSLSSGVPALEEQRRHQQQQPPRPPMASLAPS